MEDSNVKKFDRIVSILIQLQSKRVVKAQELADRFQVSLRTIYRDIKTLEQSGVPVIGEAGAGYSIMEGYRLPPVMFSRDEATSFVAAEKLMEQYLDKSLGASFQSAMFKIKSVLKWAEKDLFDSLDENVKVVRQVAIFNESVPNALEAIMHGITNKKQVAMAYQSLESASYKDRIIEPIGLYHEYNHWYLVAYCFLRRDYRKFRTDRISRIEVLSSGFEKMHQNLDFYLQPAVSATRRKNKVVWKVERKIAHFLQSSRKYYGFVSEKKENDSVIMTFEVDDQHSDYLLRWFMMFADHIEILEPLSFKEQAKKMLTSFMEIIQKK